MRRPPMGETTIENGELNITRCMMAIMTISCRGASLMIVFQIEMALRSSDPSAHGIECRFYLQNTILRILPRLALAPHQGDFFIFLSPEAPGLFWFPAGDFGCETRRKGKYGRGRSTATSPLRFFRSNAVSRQKRRGKPVGGAIA